MKPLVKGTLSLLIVLLASPAWATGAGEPLQDFEGKGLFSSWFEDEEEKPEPKADEASDDGEDDQNQTDESQEDE